jgi:hypothetical protein
MRYGYASGHGTWQNNIVDLGVVGHIAVEGVVAVGAGVHGLFVTFTDIVEIH